MPWGPPSSSSSKPSSSKAPTSSTKKKVSISGGFNAEYYAKLAKKKQSGILDWAASPAKQVLDFTSRPAYAVGNLIKGDYKGALKAVAPFNPLGPLGTKAISGSYSPNFKRTLPGQALADRGLIPDKGWAGFVAKTGVDIFADPTTYVSFGGATAVRQAGRAASLRLSQEAVRAAEAGARPRPAVVGMATAEAALEQGTVKPAASFSVKIPFTRGRKVKVLESEKAYSAIAALPKKVGETNVGAVAQDAFRPGGRTNRVVHRLVRSMETAAANDKKHITKQAFELGKEVGRVAKKLGMKAEELSDRIVRHIDDPDNFAVPAGAEAIMKKAIGIRDEYEQIAREAGLVGEGQKNYIKHALIDEKPKGLSPFAKRPVEKGFEKKRSFKTISELEAHLKRTGSTARVNTDIASLLEQRGHEGIDALRSKAEQEALGHLYGVAGKMEEIPDVMKFHPSARVSKTVFDRGAVTRMSNAALRAAGVPDEAIKRLALAKKNGYGLESAISNVVGTAQKRLTAVVNTTQGSNLTKLKNAAIKAQRKNEETLARVGGVVDDETMKTVTADWQEFSRLKGTKIPPEIKQSYDEAIARMDRQVSTAAGVSEMASFVNRLGAQWKTLALLSPGFHIRNMFDDSLRAYFAGARNPVSYIQSSRILSGKGDNIMFEFPDGTKMSGKALRLEAEATGAVDRGFVARELGNRRSHRIGEGRVSQGSKKVGDFRENATRLGTYIEMRKRGEHAFEAARITKEAHFDYGDVSNFVNAARQFWLPFVTYQSKAIPYTLKSAVQNPGRLAAINKIMEESADSNTGAPIDATGLLPGQRLSFPLPGQGENPVMVNPEGVLAFSSLNLLDPKLAQQNILGRMVNPLGRAPIEAGIKYSAFRGKSMKDPEGKTKLVRAPAWMSALAAKGIKVPGFVKGDQKKKEGYRDYVTGKYMDGVSYTTDTLGRIIPAYSQGDTVTGGAARDARFGAARWGLGLPISSYDRQEEAARAAKFAEQEKKNKK